MKRATGRGSDQFNLRFPDGMRERISLEADRSGRSMNAEIIARLSFTLDSNLGEREELNNMIDHYQKMINEYIHQIARIATEKNSIAFALDQIDAAHRRDVILLESICNFISEDQHSPEHLKSFAKKCLESIDFNVDKDVEPSKSIADTNREVHAIVRDVEENAEERAANDPWRNFDGNNNFFTTVDISQRDPRSIPDPEVSKKAEKPKKR